MILLCFLGWVGVCWLWWCGLGGGVWIWSCGCCGGVWSGCFILVVCFFVIWCGSDIVGVVLGFVGRWVVCGFFFCFSWWSVWSRLRWWIVFCVWLLGGCGLLGGCFWVGFWWNCGFCVGVGVFWVWVFCFWFRCFCLNRWFVICWVGFLVCLICVCRWDRCWRRWYCCFSVVCLVCVLWCIWVVGVGMDCWCGNVWMRGWCFLVCLFCGVFFVCCDGCCRLVFVVVWWFCWNGVRMFCVVWVLGFGCGIWLLGNVWRFLLFWCVCCWLVVCVGWCWWFCSCRCWRLVLC